tara:strand:- start:129 stop:275 length:147 start_codon:yes stop_codon:yes gene_type:complete
MSQSEDDICKESIQLKQQHQSQQTQPSEQNINVSEIEKLYLRIKEDWL